MTMKLLPMVEPDEHGVLSVPATRDGAAKLFYTLITRAGVTRRQIGDQLGLTGAAATSYVHSIRALTVGALARTAQVCGHEIVFFAHDEHANTTETLSTPTDWLAELTFDQIAQTATRLGVAVTIEATPHPAEVGSTNQVRSA